MSLFGKNPYQNLGILQSPPYQSDHSSQRNTLTAEETIRLLNEYKQHAQQAQTSLGTITDTEFRRKILAMRMRWQKETGPFQYLSTAHVPTTERVFVFLIHKDDAIVLSDDAYLFPSDTLLSQLRLLND